MKSILNRPRILPAVTSKQKIKLRTSKGENFAVSVNHSSVYITTTPRQHSLLDLRIDLQNTSTDV
ncbi:hypothetical protein [uncultured Aquimarina sp.]|uniref:hypothetical protein n=1 Tax=uncultured Aquimarina sp. TaxID=575652 RepID=UPI00263611F5|nr:hypothetical protein [uncultured Aquimarina sp.]